MSDKSPIKIMLVDDHDILRNSLKRSLNLEDEFEVICEAKNGKKAIKLLEDGKLTEVDVILMDLFMDDQGQKDPDGYLTSRYIIDNINVKNVLELKIIILTSKVDGLLIKKAYDTGVHSYLPKDCKIDDLIKVIKLVNNGRMYYEGDIRHEMEQYIQNGTYLLPEEEERRPTPSEFEILELIAEGYTTKEIAAKRGIGIDGTEAHRRNLLKKCNAKNVAHLISIAYKKGYLKIY